MNAVVLDPMRIPLAIIRLLKVYNGALYGLVIGVFPHIKGGSIIECSRREAASHALTMLSPVIHRNVHIAGAVFRMEP